MFWSLFIFRGTQHGNLHQFSVTMSRVICGPTQEPVLVTANTGKTRERFWENADEWTGRIYLFINLRTFIHMAG